MTDRRHIIIDVEQPAAIRLPQEDTVTLDGMDGPRISELELLAQHLRAPRDQIVR